MKTKFVKLAVTLVAIFGLATITAPTFAVDICSNPNIADDIKAGAGCKGYSTPTLSNSVQSIINAIILVLGTVAVVFIIMGGVQYMTSAGDAGKIKKAKDTILYACIGLAVCALAFAIANFAINIINNSDKPAEEATLLKNSVAFLEKKL